MATWLANALGLVGMILLAVPTLRVESAAKRITELERIALSSDDDPFLRAEREAVARRTRQAKDAWNPTVRLCLYTGYLCVLAQYLVRMLFAA